MDERKEGLKRRTKAFASAVVRFYLSLDKSREELRVLGKQLLRSGTSVAANYRRLPVPVPKPNSFPKSSNAPRKPTKANCGWNFCETIAESLRQRWLRCGKNLTS